MDNISRPIFGRFCQKPADMALRYGRLDLLNTPSGEEGQLHGHLVLTGHGAVEGEEGAEDVAQLAGRLRHGVVPDQQQPGEDGCVGGMVQ